MHIWLFDGWEVKLGWSNKEGQAIGMNIEPFRNKAELSGEVRDLATALVVEANWLVLFAKANGVLGPISTCAFFCKP